MTNFDPRYQLSKDGPLSKDVRVRLKKFREKGYTLAQIGTRLGFSGAFISQLLNDSTPARIRSIHVPGLVQAIEHAEIEEGLVKGPRPGKSQPATSDASQLPLEELIRAISAKGFDVTVTPKVR